IIVAAYHGNIDMVRWLVGNGADINDRNHNGTTVAMYLKNFIAESRRFELLDDLVDMGADLNLQDYSGLTVFDYVLNSHDEELINELKRLSK
ncbi:ankyrin repeat domain-containing protein, partial [Erwinia sp. MYb416]